MNETRYDNPYASPQVLSPADDLYAMHPGQLALATRGERLLGAIIDAIVVGIPTFIMGVVLGIGLVMFLDPQGWAFLIAVYVLGVPLGMGVFLAIQGYLLANHGQTVGKRILGMQILGEDDRLVPFGPLVLKRYLPLWLVTGLPNIGWLFGLVNALAIFRSNRKCIHDDIAATKVVKLR